MAERNSNSVPRAEASSRKKSSTTRKDDRNHPAQRMAKEPQSLSAAEPRCHPHICLPPVGERVPEPSSSVPFLNKPNLDAIPGNLMQKMQSHNYYQPRNQPPQMNDAEACCRRLYQYLDHLKYPPKDNSIEFWRKFACEFYATDAKEKWCCSSYGNSTQQQPFPCPFYFPDLEPWSCHMCGAKSGKGFEAKFEILPRLLQMRFASCELGQIISLGVPLPLKVRAGIALLEYVRATIETKYEQFRVVREGRLRVFFRHDFKILLWEFCAHRHDELISREWIAPQVNQFIDASNQHTNSIYDWVGGKASQQQVQANCNLHFQSGAQLLNSVELPMINDLGFSAKHGRGLELTKVFNAMKDLMDFSIERKVGAIESLRTFPRAGNNNSASAWPGNIQTREQEPGQGSMQMVQQTADGIRKMAAHFVRNGRYNGVPANSYNAFAASGGDRSRLMVTDIQGSQREKLKGVMGGSCNPEQPYSTSHYDNPGSFQGSMFNGSSSLQISEGNSVAPQQIMENSFGAVVVESRRGKELQNAVGNRGQLLPDLDALMRGLQPDGGAILAGTSNNAGRFGNTTLTNVFANVQGNIFPGTSSHGVGLGNATSAAITEMNALVNVQANAAMFIGSSSNARCSGDTTTAVVPDTNGAMFMGSAGGGFGNTTSAVILETNVLDDVKAVKEA